MGVTCSPRSKHKCNTQYIDSLPYYWSHQWPLSPGTPEASIPRELSILSTCTIAYFYPKGAYIICLLNSGLLLWPEYKSPWVVWSIVMVTLNIHPYCNVHNIFDTWLWVSIRSFPLISWWGWCLMLGSFAIQERYGFWQKEDLYSFAGYTLI